jgi:hypothetical protein
MPIDAKTPKSKTAVALVGPRVMNLELENKLPVIAETAEPSKPYLMGNPDTRAYAIPWGMANRETLTAARQSAMNDDLE